MRGTWWSHLHRNNNNSVSKVFTLAPQGPLKAFPLLLILIFTQPYKVGIPVTPILQMRRLRKK